MTVYDIFGAVSQTVQGADRIAEIVKGLVLMTDFFKGEPLPLSVYLPDTDEKMKTAEDFKANVNIEKGVERFVQVVKEAKGKEEFENVKSWGALCNVLGWKGLPSHFRTELSVQVGRNGTSWTKALEKSDKNYVEKYSSMYHEWKGARAELDNVDSLKEYERVWATAIHSYHERSLVVEVNWQ